MTDEAFHHKFGKIWADRTIPKLTEDERNMVEDWAAHCFQIAAVQPGLAAPAGEIYGEFGLDPERVIADIVRAPATSRAASAMKGETNIFRVLIKTLLNAGMITDRTRGLLRACMSTWTS